MIEVESVIFRGVSAVVRSHHETFGIEPGFQVRIRFGNALFRSCFRIGGLVAFGGYGGEEIAVVHLLTFVFERFRSSSENSRGDEFPFAVFAFGDYSGESLVRLQSGVVHVISRLCGLRLAVIGLGNFFVDVPHFLARRFFVCGVDFRFTLVESAENVAESGLGCSADGFRVRNVFGFGIFGRRRTLFDDFGGNVCIRASGNRFRDDGFSP